jgi:hypothetical protein
MKPQSRESDKSVRWSGFLVKMSNVFVRVYLELAIPGQCKYRFFFFMAQQPPVGPGSPHYRGFTMTDTHTVGRTPLDE